MKRLWLTFTLLVTMLSVAFFVHATCVPGDTGTAGDDTIICDVANQPAGNVEGVDGDDTIIIESGVSTGVIVSGDHATAIDGTGNDTIVNDGTVNLIYGDSNALGNGSGDDTITNNGSAFGLVGDTPGGIGSGDDVLVNNGTVTNAIIGDSGTGQGSGNDTITNNGSAGWISGDSGFTTGSGNDTITNNGTVDDIYGDSQMGAGSGNDIIINNGTVNDDISANGGDDTVIIDANTAQVGGTIDGGTDYDVLTFSLTSTDPAVLLDAAAQIAAANPNGGTITLGGHTYTWTNFEELTQLIFSMARLNGVMDPLAVFCALSGGVDVYVVSGGSGVFSLNVSEQVISNGLAQAVNDRVQIGSSSTATVYALPTGELEVVAPSGFSFSFTFQTYCGALPPPSETEPVIEEEELPAFTIINQPYGG